MGEDSVSLPVTSNMWPTKLIKAVISGLSLHFLYRILGKVILIRVYMDTDNSQYLLTSLNAWAGLRLSPRLPRCKSRDGNTQMTIAAHHNTKKTNVIIQIRGKLLNNSPVLRHEVAWDCAQKWWFRISAVCPAGKSPQCRTWAPQDPR
jgi:hypothetical protein